MTIRKVPPPSTAKTLTRRASLMATKRSVFNTQKTKRELLKTLPRYISLAHGTYESNIGNFIVAENKIFVFVSQASRYLLQNVIPELYQFFTKDDITGQRVPNVLKDWRKRTYGPGERCSILKLQYSDVQWPGMGIHELPIKNDTFTTTPGLLHGQTVDLSYINTNGPAGTYFIVSCRAVTGQPSRYSSQRTNYIFTPNSTHARLVSENVASSSLSKRRILNSSSSSQKAKKQKLKPFVEMMNLN